MHYAQGMLTVRGGMTSHAAVVARGMGTCCVSGCGAIKINEEKKEVRARRQAFKEGDYLSIDGTTGNIYGEKIKTAAASISGDFGRIMAGRTSSAACRCAPTPTRRTTPRRRPPSAPRASASAGPSTCSSRPTASAPSAR
jgi:phosphoenolpyruvate synthase/pyruvate phosphate dikinase